MDNSEIPAVVAHDGVAHVTHHVDLLRAELVAHADELDRLGQPDIPNHEQIFGAGHQQVVRQHGDVAALMLNSLETKDKTVMTSSRRAATHEEKEIVAGRQPNCLTSDRELIRCPWNLSHTQIFSSAPRLMT